MIVFSAGSVERDDGKTGLMVHVDPDVTDIDSLRIEMMAQRMAGGIVTDPPDQDHFLAEPGRRYGLVGPLSPRAHEVPVAQQGLSRSRESVDRNDKILIDGTNHNNGHGTRR